MKETAPVARLRAGDYRVVSMAQEVARSDGGELTQVMRRVVERKGFKVTEGQVLALEWGRTMDLGADRVGAQGLGGRKQMVRVRAGGRAVAGIMLGGWYDDQFGKGEHYVENGRMVSVRSGTASQGGENLANPTKFRQEIYIDDAGLLVISQDWEMPYRSEEEEVVLSWKEIVKARRISA